MDLKMFIEFPGILITIGVILLIIAIIIGIIAFKKVDENENTNTINREIEDHENSINEIGTDIPDEPIEEVPVNQSNFDNYKPHADLEKTQVFENNFANNTNISTPVAEVTIEEQPINQPAVEQIPVIEEPIVEQMPVVEQPVVSTPIVENTISNEEDIELL